ELDALRERLQLVPQRPVRDEYFQKAGSGSPIGGFALFEREPQHFLDSPGKVERHLLADALGDVVQVLLVALGLDGRLTANPVGVKYLLLDTRRRADKDLRCV